MLGERVAVTPESTGTQTINTSMPSLTSCSFPSLHILPTVCLITHLTTLIGRKKNGIGLLPVA
jgi:hypothetical protein